MCSNLPHADWNSDTFDLAAAEPVAPYLLCPFWDDDVLHLLQVLDAYVPDQGHRERNDNCRISQTSTRKTCLAPVFHVDPLETVATIESTIPYFLERTRKCYLFYPRATKTQVSDSLQLASFCKHHTLQVLAAAESICINLFDTRRDLHALDIAAVEPAISDSICSLWDNNVFLFPEVPNAYTASRRLW